METTNSTTEAASDAARTQGSPKPAGLGTFQGVFRPTVLTILGLMMYVREGWVVGQAGLLGALLIILATFLITGATALSISSITTNIHIGAGGVFSIISKSLGLETGGSIGVPLYFGQALSGALYIYGFTEGWLHLFPGHSQWLVAYSVFALALAVAFISSNVAFRVQGIVMIIILASLISILLGATGLGEGATYEPNLWGSFEDASFWTLFAIFFPGGTGIMVGASMSGALSDPRKSIPRGTLAAVGTALAVYVGMAIWYSVVASPAELQSDYLIVVEKAALGELVLAGLLASTFTATISTMVAAPHVLQALAKQNIIPKSDWLSRRAPSGDPRNATLVTGGLVAATLLLGGLDAVAVLITMFFLIIYLTINGVLALEQGLGMMSFRPTFSIPAWIPLFGVGSCSIALFIISPFFTLVALGLILGVYVYLVSRQLQTPWQTVRSSIFVSLADWASKQVARTRHEPNERSWKPDLLVPITDRAQLDGVYRFLRLLTEPKGSIKIIGVRLTEGDRLSEGLLSAEDFTEGTLEEGGRVSEESRSPEGRRLTGEAPDSSTSSAIEIEQLNEATRSFHSVELMATSAVVEAPSLLKGVQMSASVLRGSAFRPNVLFGMAHRYDEETVQGFVDVADQYEMGVALYYEHPDAGLSQERRLNVWITDQSPDWELGLRLPNLDLSILLGLKISQKWQGEFRLITVCRDSEEMPRARRYHERLIEDARLPETTQSRVLQGAFRESLSRAPEADLNVLGLAREVDKSILDSGVRQTRSSCLFVRDSGWESALA